MSISDLTCLTERNKNIIRVIKARRIRQAIHVGYMINKEHIQTFVQKILGRDNFGEVGIQKRKMLKVTSWEQVTKVWADSTDLKDQVIDTCHIVKNFQQ
jgi:hypothetical protein